MNEQRPHDRAEDEAVPTADTAGEEERARALVDELRRLRVQDLALDMAVSLVTVGYQKLGLTGQTRELRDLGEARLSIELLRACLDVLERERPGLALADLRGTLSAMQLSFARAVDEERAAAAAGERPAAADVREEAAPPRATPMKRTKPTARAKRTKPAGGTGRETPAAGTRQTKQAGETKQTKPAGDAKQTKPAGETKQAKQAGGARDARRSECAEGDGSSG